MADVMCRTCGKRYDYSGFDCCPECGAYNRPPRHDRVNADGTVQHMSDADYAKRKNAALGKVCFEEKECHEEKVCYEDEVRGQRTAAKRGVGVRLAVILAAVIIIVGVVASVFAQIGSKVRMPEPAVDVKPPVTLPAIELETAETFTARDGSTFRLLDWRREDDAIVVELEVEFADSEHVFYATIECVDAGRNDVVLEEFEDVSDKTVVLRFLTEDKTLTPRAFVLEEWDWDTEEGLVSTWWAGLPPKQ